MTVQKQSSSKDEDQLDVFVHVYHSPLFAAHWSFFIPRPDCHPDIGDRIHATGDRLNGFKYEYVPNYDSKEEKRQYSAILIGRIACSSLKTIQDEGEWYNLIDRVCRDVPVPGPSLNSALSRVGIPKRTEVKDCQWWIKQAVKRLVEEDILMPLEGDDAQSEDPISRVDKLPRH